MGNHWTKTCRVCKKDRTAQVWFRKGQRQGPGLLPICFQCEEEQRKNNATGK